MKVTTKLRFPVDELFAKVRCTAGPCDVRLKGIAVVKSRDEAGAVTAKKRFKLRQEEFVVNVGETRRRNITFKRNTRSLARMTELLEDGATGAVRLNLKATRESAFASIRLQIGLQPGR